MEKHASLIGLGPGNNVARAAEITAQIGAFGFYPWIDAGMSWCGIVARHVVSDGEGFDSAACGRLIRKAWVTAVAQ